MASGRIAERERFVRDFLRYHGARLEGPDHGAFVAELPAALVRRLKAPLRLEVAFRPAELSEHPGATLLAPGNPLFDRMLRLARRGGGLSRRYLRPERMGEPASWLPSAGALAAARLGTPAYRRRLLFTFRIAYRAFEGYDDIRSVVVGANPPSAADGRDFFRDRNLTEEPEPGIDPAPPVDVEAALLTALAEIERRIAPQMARFVQRAEGQLANETERLREFYLAAIAEEKTRRERRNGPRDDHRSEGRGEPEVIAATGRKLEWVERVDRETRLFAPRVTVTLLGLEEIWMPVCPLALGTPEEGVAAELDLASGEITHLVCQTCKTPLGGVPLTGARLSSPQARGRVAGAETVCYPPPSHDSPKSDSPKHDSPEYDSPRSDNSWAQSFCPSCARASGRA